MIRPRRSFTCSAALYVERIVCLAGSAPVGLEIRAAVVDFWQVLHGCYQGDAPKA